MICVYDVETFPNFFSVCFYNIDTEEFRDFVIHSSRNDLTKLRRFFNKIDWLIGFNNDGYDNIIMRYVAEGKDVTPETINRLSNLIINTRNNGDKLYEKEAIRPYLKKYRKSIDLMSIHALHKIGVSLKQVAVVLRHDRIQDLPKDPAAFIFDDEIDDVLDYGRNDVIITNKLYEYSIDDIKLRHSVGNQYGVNVLSGSRTYIAKEILNKYYEEYTKVPLRDFKELRSYYKALKLGDVVSDFKFKTEPLQELYKTIQDTVVDSDYKLSHVTSTKAMTYQLGMGGLHSKNKNDIYEATDDYKLLDIDWGSYYPNLMLKYELYPRHLTKDFLKVLSSLTKKRLKAKADGDKITADTLKISINSIFGLTGFDKYWLKDDRVMYGTTVNGQLLLLATIEHLESLGDIECYSANTDGASFKVHVSILDKVIAEVKRVEARVGISLEYEMYQKMIFKDVNNYIWISEDGKVKRKGIFLYEQNITKGFRHPIVSEALFQYYVNDIPVKETIMFHTDVYDFCIAQRTGRQFKTFFRTVQGMEKLQKTNRYFVSTVSGSLIKVKHKDDGTIRENQAVAGENVFILNDYDESKLEYYNSIIKRSWYIKETNKIINSFTKNQYKLF